MIWAQDLNGAIGYKNDLLFPLPEDLKYFARQTKNSVVVMGRLTWDSLPEKNKPLPKRKNIILTRSPLEIKEENIEIHTDFNNVLQKYKNENIWIIGGSQIYKSLLEYADRLYITQISERAQNADVFAPPQDKIDELFKISEESDTMVSVYRDIPFQFKTFERR